MRLLFVSYLAAMTLVALSGVACSTSVAHAQTSVTIESEDGSPPAGPVEVDLHCDALPQIPPEPGAPGQQVSLKWTSERVGLEIEEGNSVGCEQGLTPSDMHVSIRVPGKFVVMRTTETGVWTCLGHPTESEPQTCTERYHPDIHWSLPALSDTEEAVRRFTIPRPPQPGGLKAVAGGPYSVVRGHEVQLDGSRSKGQITKYRWHFTPVNLRRPTSGRFPPSLSGHDGDCEPGTRLHEFTGKSERLSIRVLCTIKATLTVYDKHGNSDPDSTTITVTPRAWTTPPTSYGETPPPRAARHLFTYPRSNTDNLYGLNACADGRIRDSLCAPCKDKRVRVEADCDHKWRATWDPSPVNGSGPFKGFSYVSSTTFRTEPIQRIGMINPDILPHGARPEGAPNQPNFYRANELLLDSPDIIARWLQAVRQHEGYGDRKPHSQTGHEQMLDEALHALDPARVLERGYASDENDLVTRNRNCLDRINSLVSSYSGDDAGDPNGRGHNGLVPVPGFNTPDLALWAAHSKQWLVLANPKETAGQHTLQTQLVGCTPPSAPAAPHEP